jgi:sporulation protein YlmC with PRC-barrel domain
MESITSDDILGKTAVDPYGSLLGVVVKLHIDNKEKKLQGITIDQGFMKPDLFVGIDHVKQFGLDAILLRSIPYNQLEGKEVLDARGHVLGNIHKVLTNGPDLSSLVVRKKKGTFKSEEITIDAKEIKEIGETIILRRRSEHNV